MQQGSEPCARATRRLKVQRSTHAGGREALTWIRAVHPPPTTAPFPTTRLLPQDRFGFEWNQRGQHPTVDAWAEAVRDDWAKFMHKVGGCSSHVAYSQPTFDE